MFVHDYCRSGICCGVRVDLFCYIDVIPNVKKYKGIKA